MTVLTAVRRSILTVEALATLIVSAVVTIAPFHDSWDVPLGTMTLGTVVEFVVTVFIGCTVLPLMGFGVGRLTQWILTPRKVVVG